MWVASPKPPPPPRALRVPTSRNWHVKFPKFWKGSTYRYRVCLKNHFGKFSNTFENFSKKNWHLGHFLTRFHNRNSAGGSFWSRIALKMVILWLKNAVFLAKKNLWELPGIVWVWKIILESFRTYLNIFPKKIDILVTFWPVFTAGVPRGDHFGLKLPWKWQFFG